MTSKLFTTEMPTLEPILRDRLKKPAPSVRSASGSVDNVAALSGTNRKPRPAPCTIVTPMIEACDTSGVHPVMALKDHAVRLRPIASRIRVSTRPTSRPTISIEAMVPTPRGPMTNPAVTTG